MFRVLAAFLVLAPAAQAQTAVACRFGELPVMLFLFEGREGTVQIGPGVPHPLSIGSSLMMANDGSREFVFYLREPASVTIDRLDGGKSLTFRGECESSARNP